MADQGIHERLANGDEDAFAEVYSALTPSMIRVAQAITGNRASAEEIAQDTWLSVIKNVATFEGKSSFKNWVFAILSNKARTMAKRDGRNMSLVPEPDNNDNDADELKARFAADGSWSDPPTMWDEITPERIVAGREIWQLVRQCIQSLPPVQQAILDLLEGEKLPAAQIATLLDLSEGNVRVQLHRARERIRQALERELDDQKK